MRTMHVVAIGWLYVTVLMAFTQPTVVSGVSTFLFYGLFPAGLTVWILDAPRRRRRRQAADSIAASVTVADGLANEPDGHHPERDQ